MHTPYQMGYLVPSSGHWILWYKQFDLFNSIFPDWIQAQAQLHWIEGTYAMIFSKAQADDQFYVLLQWKPICVTCPEL